LFLPERRIIWVFVCVDPSPGFSGEVNIWSCQVFRKKKENTENWTYALFVLPDGIDIFDSLGVIRLWVPPETAGLFFWVCSRYDSYEVLALFVAIFIDFVRMAW
jgi:hypothetical protein